jgi:hypothetical protein
VTVARDPRFTQEYTIVSQSDPNAHALALTQTGNVTNQERIGYVLYRRVN